jgi:hypothetical protein
MKPVVTPWISVSSLFQLRALNIPTSRDGTVRKGEWPKFIGHGNGHGHG